MGFFSISIYFIYFTYFLIKRWYKIIDEKVLKEMKKNNIEEYTILYIKELKKNIIKGKKLY